MDKDTNSEQSRSPGVDPDVLAELRRHLSNLAGSDLPLTESQILDLFHPIGTRTMARGEVTYAGVVVPKKFCAEFDLQDVTGQIATRGDGAVTFPLSDFICKPPESYLPPVNLVATPVSDRPVFVTTRYKLVPIPNLPHYAKDAEITLMTWSPNGAPAPETVVDWCCRTVVTGGTIL